MARFDDRREVKRRQKKLLLLISDLNPLFRDIECLERAAGLGLTDMFPGATPRAVPSEDQQFRPTARHTLLGVGAETLRKWGRLVMATGTNAAKPVEFLQSGLDRARRYFEATHTLPNSGGGLSLDAARRLSQQLVDRIARFKDDYDDKGQREYVYATAERLGMSVASAQLAIDAAVYAASPLLLQPYKDSKGIQADFELVGGFYSVLLRRKIPDSGACIWLRAALNVRYALSLEGRYVLRAKMNFPSLYRKDEMPPLDKEGLEDKKPHWEYDGIVDVRVPPKEQRLLNDGKFNFILEKRDSFRPDYLYLITSPRKKLERVRLSGGACFVGMSGAYLTSHQDAAQTIVSGPVIFEYRSEPLTSHEGLPRAAGTFHRFPPKDAQEFMWKHAESIEKGHPDYRACEQLFAQLGLD